MRIEPDFSLEDYNTFHLPVRARWFMEYADEAELERILRDEYFHELSSLHIGGGSNLLFLNDFNGIILHSAIKGITPVKETDEAVWLRVGAAEVWDDVVAYAAGKGWCGIENLSLIPGETGAAAVQNIGAYGAEIKDVVDTVEAYNPSTFAKQLFAKEDCKYGYRDSFFKEESHDPYIITYVTLRLMKQALFNLAYGNLNEALASSAPLTPAKVREAVVRIRREKLPAPEELGNAGSFFVNPVVSQEHFDRLKREYPSLPSYPAKDGHVKIPAGWLIEQCGLKGKRAGAVGVYAHQALVIVNYGGATGNEIALFAEHIRDTVNRRFNVLLTPEVRYIG
ncbi:MAG: UDP-N-acetylmuramate dehydrogenase [Tannerella sp.]|jgi:UDP-N-acetylmuramate dehydrogenase|nr:UDP-N-acetylmuramate dehydrogenase [Tannerella sp.]